ncbi:unnamed protein product [Mytilus edulis]|uniref:Uncharacterized protein n=1 Tax=Mytilus edulis TaxID=6550 RepID=A0A8S3S4K0_MYTED|nr:unnamed protein product [Mytilus edulis]
MAYQTATHPHTTKQKSNGKSRRLPNTDPKRQVSDGISDSYPPHTTKQESNGKSDSYLTQIKDKSVMAYQTATHHTTKQESNGNGISKDKHYKHTRQDIDGISDSYHHTLQNKESIGKSGQVSDGISDSYLTQIKKDKSVMAYQTATHHTLQNKRVMAYQTAQHRSKDKSHGISDSYPPHTKNKRVMANQTPNTDQRTSQ